MRQNFGSQVNAGKRRFLSAFTGVHRRLIVVSFSLAPIVLLAWNGGTAKIRFTEIAAKAKAQPLHHTRHFKGKTGDVLRMFTSGGASVAVGDYDNDGFEDMFVTDSDDGTHQPPVSQQRQPDVHRRHRRRPASAAATIRSRSSPTRSGSITTTTAGGPAGRPLRHADPLPQRAKGNSRTSQEAPG